MSTKFDPKFINYGEACGEGTKFSMRRDQKVLVYGLGVDDPKGMYGTTAGLAEEFGKDRCFDTPLSEDAMTGVGIGLAMNGFRPIHIHQRFDFLLLVLRYASFYFLIRVVFRLVFYFQEHNKGI